ncbi:MAG: ATP-binding protein, partial [Proteobacteria bacterium]|nr:ATP-binding protein [Pseudomonadota bacterium]
MLPPRCACDGDAHTPRLVVLTGGPGAGKTAALEVARRELCGHVQVIPEAASLLWRGGFPRLPGVIARRAAQRAIVHVQIELQAIAVVDQPALVLCDRGTLDGLAYWPGNSDDYYTDLGTTRAAELGRYATVIHLRPPNEEHGYRSDAWRPES